MRNNTANELRKTAVQIQRSHTTRGNVAEYEENRVMEALTPKAASLRLAPRWMRGALPTPPLRSPLGRCRRLLRSHRHVAGGARGTGDVRGPLASGIIGCPSDFRQLHFQLSAAIGETSATVSPIARNCQETSATQRASSEAAPDAPAPDVDAAPTAPASGPDFTLAIGLGVAALLAGGGALLFVRRRR